MRLPQFQSRNVTQASPGKFDRLPRTPAGSTALALDGCGLRDSLPARPAREASYPISVRQVAVLLHTSFRHRLAVMPLCFAKPSPPSGWLGDLHPQAIEHARHATNPLARESRGAHHYNTDDDAREATAATRRYRRSPSGRGRDQSFVPAVNRSSYSQALQPSLEFAPATAYATR